MTTTYKIVRFYQERGRRIVARGVTLEEARSHCSDPDTSSQTCTSKTGRARTKKYGPWFDGYQKERG